MTTKGAKRHYERPRMKVVKLQNQSHLLQSSGGGLGSPDHYPGGGDPFDF